MTGKKALRVREHIQILGAAIERIETYVQGLDLAAFIDNTLVQDAVISNFEIIGEAANKVLSEKNCEKSRSASVSH